MPSPAHIAHVGPRTNEAGGMASVIDVLVTGSIGGEARAISSWTPKSRRARALLALRAMWQVARLPAGSVVHVHVATAGSVLRKGLILRVARARRLPTVATLHGARLESFAERFPWLMVRLLRMCDEVLVLSDRALEIVNDLTPSTPARRIVNPIDADAAPSPAGEQPPVVLFAGEVGERKGIDVLCQAWPDVAARVPDATLVIAGPATEIVVPDLPRATVLPEQSRARVVELMRTSRVVALPSRAEALPMALLEACGRARPFVSTPVGDIARLAATGGGTIVPVGDAAALADALVGYLTDPAAATAAGAAAHELCERDYGHAALDARMRPIYAAARDR